MWESVYAMAWHTSWMCAFGYGHANPHYTTVVVRDVLIIEDRKSCYDILWKGILMDACLRTR
jgi:hypothetical protein